MKKSTWMRWILACLLVVLAVRTASAFPSQVITYTVRYSCIVSPDMRGHVEGEWVTGCDGVTTGWGWEPGHNCTTTDITWGATCPTGGGGGGGGGGPHDT
jgi:hypothetical protein